MAGIFDLVHSRNAHVTWGQVKAKAQTQGRCPTLVQVTSRTQAITPFPSACISRSGGRAGTQTPALLGL